MVSRCNVEQQGAAAYYRDCTHASEWLSYDNYIAWARVQVGFMQRDSKGRVFQLDKDILNKGNKSYSPENCVFVPPALNTFLVTNKVKRGNYPLGVSFSKEKQRFKSELRLHFTRTKKHLGYFDTPEEAFYAYKLAKEALAKVLASHYTGWVDNRVIFALNNLNIDIGD